MSEKCHDNNNNNNNNNSDYPLTSRPTNGVKEAGFYQNQQRPRHLRKYVRMLQCSPIKIDLHYIMASAYNLEVLDHMIRSTKSSNADHA